MYLCLLGILTLVTSVSSRGNTLMNYIANNNKNVLGLIDNTSFSAYLTGAYNLRGFNGGQLAGGGLLGMLIAYPVYSVFNTVGGATLLIMLELVLLLVLLRLNPAELITSMSDRTRLIPAIDRAFDHVAQLADVARPVIVDQRIARLG